LGTKLQPKKIPSYFYTKRPATFKFQNEHNCNTAALAPLVKILKLGGIHITVKTKPVVAKVWIHFFMGDTSGHNRWLGHFNSGAKIQRPYHDCKCGTDDMTNSTPTCIYLTREDYHQNIAHQSTSQDKTNLDSSLSKHPIKNAFMNKNIPLLDLKCGVYGMTPPERLHTTCEGCTKYIFKSLLDTIAKCTKVNALIREMELLH
jgi:hypothetical protein